MVSSLIIAVIVAVLGVVVAIQNAAPATIRFFAWEFTGSLALIALIFFAAGIIISVLFALPGMIHRGWSAARNKRKSEHLEREADALRGELSEAQREPDGTAQKEGSEAPQ